MNNIFERAKFGDKFECIYGTIVIYLRRENDGKNFLVNKLGTVFTCYDNGEYTGNNTASFTVVSKYQEPIDEEKLENKYYIRNILKFAEQFDKENYGTRISGHFDSDKEYLEMKINYIQKTIEKG